MANLGSSTSSAPAAEATSDPLPASARPRSSTRGLQLQISERRLLLMAGDALVVTISVLAALRIWALVAQSTFDLDFVLPEVYWFFLLTFIWFVLASANDFYNLNLASHIGASAVRLMQITAQLVIVYLLIFFLSTRDALPRLFILYYALIFFFLMLLWRAWRPFLFRWPGFRRRALIVGAGWPAEAILGILTSEAKDAYEVVGVINEEQAPGQELGSKLVLGGGVDLPGIVEGKQIAELIIAYGNELPSSIFQGIMACYEKEIAIMPMPILYEQLTGRVPIEHVGRQHWTVVLPLEGHSVFNLYGPLKRGMDVTLSVVGLAIFVLVLPVLALIMTLDSPGPLFYQQERVGRGGRIFKIIKLRSMIPNAEGVAGPQWAQKNDPRVTRVGRILRKTRLDEVPQLLNVLRGEMSMIGPRPERPFFVDQLTAQIPFYRTRLAVKPGVTGWAQVMYRYGNSREDALIKLQYDLYYIRHQSVTLDMLILLRTAGKMMAFQGT